MAEHISHFVKPNGSTSGGVKLQKGIYNLANAGMEETARQSDSGGKSCRQEADLRSSCVNDHAMTVIPHALENLRAL